MRVRQRRESAWGFLDNIIRALKSIRNVDAIVMKNKCSTNEKSTMISNDIGTRSRTITQSQRSKDRLDEQCQ
jgi:hypothetical protein